MTKSRFHVAWVVRPVDIGWFVLLQGHLSLILGSWWHWAKHRKFESTSEKWPSRYPKPCDDSGDVINSKVSCRLSSSSPCHKVNWLLRSLWRPMFCHDMNGRTWLQTPLFCHLSWDKGYTLIIPVCSRMDYSLPTFEILAGYSSFNWPQKSHLDWLLAADLKSFSR